MKAKYTKEEINLATFGVKNIKDIKVNQTNKIMIMTKEKAENKVPHEIPTFFSVQNDLK